MSYSIKVVRNTSNGSGILSYTSGNTSVSTTCWFELANPIPAKTYNLCSATTMSTKTNSSGGDREAIYLPNDQTGRRGIFIHMGSSPAWSEGCIVIIEPELLKIWNSISPKNGHNVSITITNQ